MSVFGSLFTAVSGLTAQSQSMGMISNNIANVSTVGYKRTDASFSSLVTNESRSTLYSPGSVQALQNQRISLQGILQQSNSATDLAISGNGFFIVRGNTTDPTAETLFTRAGSFSEDENGVLKNPQGFNLYGWPLDANGDIIGSTTNISSLVPVNVAFPGGLSVMTTTAELDANLNANQLVTGSTNFTREIEVFDSLGGAHTLSVNFQKHDPTTTTLTGNLNLNAQSGNFVPGTDTFDIDVNGGGAVTITLDGDVTKLITDLNAVAGVDAHIDADGFLVIQNEVIGETLELLDGAGTPLANGTIGLADTGGAVGPPPAATPLAGTTIPPGTENPNGWWTVSFVAPGGVGTLLSGDINFDSTGNLNAVETAAGSVPISLGPTNWGDPGLTAQTIDFDIFGLTQFAGSYSVSNADQNGSALGFRTGVSVDADGIVSAQFSNGLSREVYQLGIATFANPDGLNPLTGNVFRVSDTSGLASLTQANNNGAGVVEGGALEQSNVDLADEFSKMIVTQRAYSANTKVITTADQMTAELLQLR